MTIYCKLCKLFVTGPDAPATILDSEQRRVFEFGALYPFIAKHTMEAHGELAALVVTLVDQYSLALLAKVFSSNDAVTFEALRARLCSAAWLSLDQPPDEPQTLALPPHAGLSV